MSPRDKGNRVIDWSDLRRRVDAVGRALAESAPPPEELALLLEERARVLARPVTGAAWDEEPKLISFSIAGETYGVEPRRVLEVCRVGHLTPLPQAEPWIAGLTAWRGELVLAVDLRRLLGAAVSSRPQHPTLVVLGKVRPQLGIVADAPGDLLAISGRDLRAAPDGVTGSQYLRGMTRDAVLVLDVDRVLEGVAPEPA
jgi:purine-binding chemotaxis protein CheW